MPRWAVELPVSTLSRPATAIALMASIGPSVSSTIARPTVSAMAVKPLRRCSKAPS